MFAKLFGEGEDQVLVTKEEEEGSELPTVNIRFEGPDNEITLVSKFGNFEARDLAFDKAAQETAFGIRDGILEKLRGAGNGK
jgi:hypothetical protein